MIRYILKCSMIIMSMLTSLKTYAFVGEAMIDGIQYYIVTKGKTATVIGYEKARSGYELVDIVIPSTIEYDGVICNVVKIQSRAFAYDGYKSSGHDGSFIKSVTIGSGIKEIGERAFENCYKLITVTFSNTDSLHIGKSAFKKCLSLDAVHVSDIGNWLKIFFEDERSNPLRAPHDVGGTEKSELFLNGKVVKNLSIPYGVVSINPYAFEYCESLESITIPNTVTSIGTFAFGMCHNVEKIVLPPSLTSIAYCGVDFFASKSVHVYITDLVSFCNMWTQESFIAAPSLFLYLNGKEIKELIIPNNIQELRSVCFQNMDGITKITIPNSVASIGREAFANNDELLSVVINCPNVGDYNFQYCGKLKSVTIGENCETIGNNSMYHCPELTDVYCFAKTPPFCKSAVFHDCEIQYATLHVPDQFIQMYQSTSPWNRFGNIIALTESEMADVKDLKANQESTNSTAFYSLDGQYHKDLQKGLNIIRYSDGTTKKVLVK